MLDVPTSITILVIFLIARFLFMRAMEKASKRDTNDLSMDDGNAILKGAVKSSSYDEIAAQIYSHVEKTLIPSRSEPLPRLPLQPDREVIEATVKQYARMAVKFRRDLKPSRPVTTLTFFGGLPVAPPMFAWPRNKKGLPLVFMGQLDLADLPETAFTARLPRHGLFYFFAPVGNDGSEVVRYASSPSDMMAELPPPSDLPHFNTSGMAPFWKHSTQGMTRIFPKWPVSPVVVASHPESPRLLSNEVEFDIADDDDYAVDLLWGNVSSELDQQANTEAFGKPRSYSSEALAPFGWAGARRNEGMPRVWMAVEGVLAGLEEQVQRRHEKLGKYEPRLLQRAQELAAARGKLLDEARNHPPTEPVPPAAWTRFINHLEASCRFGQNFPRATPLRIAFEPGSRVWQEPMLEAIEHCLSTSAESTDMITPAQVDLIRHRVDNRGTQLGGWPTVVQEGSAEYGSITNLLMQFAHDPGQGWYGDSVIHYWISDEDIEAQRWNKIFATYEAS